MRKAKLGMIFGLLVLLSAAVFAGVQPRTQDKAASAQQPVTEEAIPTFGTTVLKYGSSGQDIYELQGRLKFLGFYSGKIDGQYGWTTLKSVKWFQSEFGMKVDGTVGAKTKLKLYNATKNWKPSENTAAKEPAAGNNNNAGGDKSEPMASANTMGLSENDLKIMANAVYGESRGEPFEGQVAVAAVILNRVKSPSFPNTVHGVIFQPGAFTAVADGQIWLEPNEVARKAVQQALNGWDPSGGCLYYFNPKTATSKWIWSRPQVKTIGQHIFCM
ncbi:spore cortex-lytic enzyme [Paenibacillus chibensis]|uniref:Spore cortex-lytic enzyme n=1 Tax=Paenibacillus chibensis TaxID=59846 RepID=A0ABU6PSF1_9BACL|nr:spore cortex-lytic enzyme [Paenibacillus chibensis]MEC0373500.1 spore cortex-lytic enzyme [Paenibacillus chibensis]MED5016955.1 spore cortex-lytic enzyme [Paenibacillus chibensis]